MPIIWLFVRVESTLNFNKWNSLVQFIAMALFNTTKRSLVTDVSALAGKFNQGTLNIIASKNEKQIEDEIENRIITENDVKKRK